MAQFLKHINICVLSEKTVSWYNSKLWVLIGFAVLMLHNKQPQTLTAYSNKHFFLKPGCVCQLWLCWE